MPSVSEDELHVDGQCYSFDPRRRPWYAAAIAGGKNIIILIDIKKAMSNDIGSV